MRKCPPCSQTRQPVSNSSRTSFGFPPRHARQPSLLSTRTSMLQGIPSAPCSRAATPLRRCQSSPSRTSCESSASSHPWSGPGFAPGATSLCCSLITLRCVRTPRVQLNQFQFAIRTPEVQTAALTSVDHDIGAARPLIFSMLTRRNILAQISILLAEVLLRIFRFLRFCTWCR
ncbi:hypothetical protein BC827DRAFT_1185344 [Russula dissimulans]|nr:hypothetical protein BC827DRAFT_1185344 [Russula dissimulans]